MKKLFFTLTVLFASFIFISCSDDDDKEKRINFSEVPSNTKEFLKAHFDDFDENAIAYTELDKDGTYDIKFKNGIEMEFYSNGVWKDIDLNGNTLPNSIAMLLPENALNYIGTNYPNAIIEEIEKIGDYSESGQGFKIELKNDRDIYFDAVGNVLKDKGEGSKDKESLDIEKLPKLAQAFLKEYFKDEVPSKIEKEWNKYEVKYNEGKANEVEIEFFSDGSFKNIEIEGTNNIIRSIIQGVSNTTTILDYLDKNHAGERIEEFSMASSIVGANLKGGYVVEIDGKVDYKIYFNAQGKHVISIKD